MRHKTQAQAQRTAAIWTGLPVGVIGSRGYRRTGVVEHVGLAGATPPVIVGLESQHRIAGDDVVSERHTAGEGVVVWAFAVDPILDTKTSHVRCPIGAGAIPHATEICTHVSTVKGEITCRRAVFSKGRSNHGSDHNQCRSEALLHDTLLHAGLTDTAIGAPITVIFGAEHAKWPKIQLGTCDHSP